MLMVIARFIGLDFWPAVTCGPFFIGQSQRIGQQWEEFWGDCLPQQLGCHLQFRDTNPDTLSYKFKVKTSDQDETMIWRV